MLSWEGAVYEWSVERKRALLSSNSVSCQHEDCSSEKDNFLELCLLVPVCGNFQINSAALKSRIAEECGLKNQCCCAALQLFIGCYTTMQYDKLYLKDDSADTL